MRAASTLTAIGLTLTSAAAPALGASFGRSANATELGQPLNFTASIRPDTDETLTRDCVFVEVQSGENPLPAAQIRYALESPNESSEQRLRVTTRVPIDEPVVTVVLTVGCDAKVTRRFVAFVDPPGVNLAQSAAPVPIAPAPAAAPPPRSAEAPAPARLATDDGARSERSARAARRSRPAETAAVPPPRVAVASRPVGVTAAASAPRPAEPRSRATLAVRVPKAPPGPRLRLEPGPPQLSAAASAPSPTASAAAPVTVLASTAVVAGPSAVDPLDAARAVAAAFAASAASGPPPAAAAAVSEQQRIQSLEDGLLKLRNESRSNEAAVAALQARLQQAESERYGNPLVYALALLSALLALGLVLIGRRQAVARRTGQWWVGKEPGPVPSMYQERGTAPSVLPAPPRTAAPAAPAPRIEAVAPPAPAVRASQPVREAAAPPEPTRPASFVAATPVAKSPATPPRSEPAAPAHELSVEELIDLEQQVDFFVVLGQDDAAIELLMSHVRRDGGISPLPYLKLLEIYRRRGDGAAYQQIRERFNHRFNSHAPSLDNDPARGRTLADYPETMVRIQQLWPLPAQAMEALDATLMRRHHAEETFDLPAYRELLLLYSVARDLAGHPAASPEGGVDLMLPLDEPVAAPIRRLSATVSGHDDFQASDLNTLPVDLDISFAPPPAAPAPPPTPLGAETVPAALRRTDNRLFSTESNFMDFNVDAKRLPGESRRDP